MTTTDRLTAIAKGKILLWQCPTAERQKSMAEAIKASLVKNCLPYLSWEGLELYGTNMPLELYTKFYFWSSGYGDGQASLS